MVKQDIAIRSVSLCFVMQISVNLLIQARVVLETLNENIFKTAKKISNWMEEEERKITFRWGFQDFSRARAWVPAINQESGSR